MLNKNQLLHTYLNIINEDRKNAIKTAKDNQDKLLRDISKQQEQLCIQLYDELKNNNLIDLIKSHANNFLNEFLNSKIKNGILFNAIFKTISEICNIPNCDHEIVKNYQNIDEIKNNSTAVKMCEISIKYDNEFRQLWYKFENVFHQNPKENITDQDTGFVDYFNQPLYLNDMILYFGQHDLFYGIIVDSDENNIYLKGHKKHSAQIYEIDLSSTLISNNVVCIEDLKLDPSIFDDLKTHIEI